jgi:hypothetical protein
VCVRVCVRRAWGMPYNAACIVIWILSDVAHAGSGGGSSFSWGAFEEGIYIQCGSL